jgi:predicted RNase H-like nuclease (RuvC/YqgF family)
MRKDRFIMYIYDSSENEKKLKMYQEQRQELQASIELLEGQYTLLHQSYEEVVKLEEKKSQLNEELNSKQQTIEQLKRDLQVKRLIYMNRISPSINRNILIPHGYIYI